MAGHARPCRKDQYETMTGAFGSMRLMFDGYIRLVFSVTNKLY